MGLLATAALVVLHQCRQTSRGDLVSDLESVSNDSDSDSNHDGEEVDDADDACDGEHAEHYTNADHQAVPLTGGKHPHKIENQKVIKSKEKIEGIRLHKLSSIAINKMNTEDTDQAAAEVTAEEVLDESVTVRGTGSSRPFKKGKRKKSKAENKGSTPQEEREILI